MNNLVMSQLFSDLMIMRASTADWFNGTEPNDPALQGKKSKDAKEERILIPSRAVGPSPTQLEILRCTTFALLNGKKKADYSTQHIKVMEDFYKASYFYEYLLNYTNTIIAATDLGDLWYKEFYLELSKRLQFPIDMSLPW